MNKFFLMHKNEQVAGLSLTPFRIEVNEIFNSKRLPIGVQNAPDGAIHNMLTMWNDIRSIPSGRPNYNQFMQIAGISGNIDYLPLTYMCSLTDCYWFKPQNLNLQWEDVNFRDNWFGSNIYRHLFYDDFQIKINNWHSPDLTTNGMLKKMWEKQDDAFVLIKRPNYGPEPVTEFIVSKIFDNIGVEHVPYDIVVKRNEVCSSCPCFIKSNNEEFVPFDNLLTDLDKNSKHAFDILCQFGFEDEGSTMIIGDYIVGNVDRHPKNYGFVVDSETQRVVRMAPFFDHGDSKLTERIENRNSKLGDRSFDTMLRKIDTKYFDKFLNVPVASMMNGIEPNKYISQHLINSCYDAIGYRLDTLNEIKLELERGYERDR